MNRDDMPWEYLGMEITAIINNLQRDDQRNAFYQLGVLHEWVLSHIRDKEYDEEA